MKIDFLPGDDYESGITTIVANRREAAFIKAGMALLYIEAAKIENTSPAPLLESYVDSIKEIIDIEGYNSNIFADFISHLESDGKVWFTYLENKFNLEPNPTPYHPDPVINAEIMEDMKEARAFDEKIGLNRCRMRSSLNPDVRCQLHEGHQRYSAVRFHKFI